MTDLWPDLIAALEIVWINVILSGDNAVVIALACRGLPPAQRKWGMILGAGAAVLLRIGFTIVVVRLLQTPFLRLVGGALLFWVAVKLIADQSNDAGEDKIKASERLWRAVWTVTVADAVMSLDNVVAIAAVAGDNMAMLIFGLVVSVPLIIAGAGLIMTLLDRFPVLVWAGAALLGWIAGEMVISDPWIVARLDGHAHAAAPWVKAASAGFVVALGWWLTRRSAPEEAAR